MASTICFLFLFLVSLEATFAAKQSYVVYLGAHSRDGKAEVTEADYEKTRDDHYSFLGTFVGSKDKAKEAILYSYTRHINGFAATLEEADAAEIANHPDVMSVFLNKARSLHTTRSWHFAGLERDGKTKHEDGFSAIWEKAKFGEGVIIATIDTGVWPESESFSDDGYDSVPSRWRGECENEQDKKFKCNKKLIGARYFNKGYIAQVGAANSTTFNSPRDMEGHGTHTLSIAGGNFVPKAGLFGVANGTAKGGSPKARLATYKVCGPTAEAGQCFDADIVAAFDMAIHDGADVISVSLGGTSLPYSQDGLAIGAFHAVKHGIVVVTSAGNQGPIQYTVANVAPWLITVGASSMDRDFLNLLILGNNMSIRGQSLSEANYTNGYYFQLVDAKTAKLPTASDADAKICKAGTLDTSKVEGKILVCLRGDMGRVEKSIEAASHGAVGMVLVNIDVFGNDTFADPHLLPAINIGYEDGLALYHYLNTSTSPVATITAPTTDLGVKPAPMVADFSARGPNYITPEILKPDIIAPGVKILAAFTEAIGPSKLSADTRQVPYNILSGTSMAGPHAAGVVGLLKAVHPDWTPAAIRSALMTTARVRSNDGTPITDGATSQKATPLAYGAGHIRPTRAMEPGLVYDLPADAYLRFLCSLGYNESQIAMFNDGPFTCPETINVLNFNYPSITVPNLNGTVTVTRTVKNVGNPATYTARIVNPPGFSVYVQPETLTVAGKGDEKTFNVTITATRPGPTKNYVFGVLTWWDGKKTSVRSQIVVNTYNSSD